MHAWSSADRDKLVLTVQMALARWATDWPPASAPSEPEVTTQNAHARDLSSRVWHAGTSADVWWSWSDAKGRGETPRRAIAALLFDAADAGTSEAGIAQELAKDAWPALWQALAGALSIAADPADHAQRDLPCVVGVNVVRPFGGSLIVHMALGDHVLHLLMDGSRVAQAIGSQSAKGAIDSAAHAITETLPRALADHRVDLQLELDAFEIDFATLGDLRVGDVLVTGHPLVVPATVRGPVTPPHAARASVCQAFLGRQGPFRAAELRSLPTPPVSTTSHSAS